MSNVISLVVVGKLLPHLKEPELKVLLHLLAVMQEQQTQAVCSSIAELVRGTGLSKNGLTIGVAGLTARGLLTTQRNASDVLGHTPTTYTLDTARLLAWVATVQPRPVTLQDRAYDRDGRVCQYCGAMDAPAYQVDHVIPRSLGGVNRLFNLVVACEPCNNRKGASVWVPRNIDRLTQEYPGWRERIMELAAPLPVLL